MSSSTNIGDVIRAWRQLGATGDEERRAIARLLGYELQVSAPAEQATTTNPSPSHPLAQPVRPASPRVRVASRPVDAPGESIELVPFLSVRDQPAVLPSFALVRPTPSHVRALAPLFAASWMRAIAGTLVSRSAPAGPVDAARVIDRLARHQPIRTLPRRKRLVSASEVSVVIDRRSTIAWFRDDADQLVERLNAVTRSRVTVVVSSGVPVLLPGGGSERDAAEDDEELESERPPSLRSAANGRVIAISDLGLGSCWSAGDPSRAEDWRELAIALRARNASLVIVTPVPLSRIPAQLQRMVPCLHWDDRTRPGQVSRALKVAR